MIVDRQGIPLATRLTGAHEHDSLGFAALVDAVRLIRRPSGRRRQRPDTLHAAKADDMPRCRQALSRRRSTIRIARKGIESRDRLGRHRWGVERTLAWLNRTRRRTIR